MRVRVGHVRNRKFLTVIGIGNSVVRDLGTHHMINVALEYGGRVRPAHREDCEAESSKGRTERREISRVLV